MCFDISRNVTFENEFFFMDVLLKNITVVTEVVNLRDVFQEKKEQFFLALSFYNSKTDSKTKIIKI